MKHSSASRLSLSLEKRILSIRGERVILDVDLAELYGVSTKRLNEQVKRNASRFPTDFAFVLKRSEKAEVVAICDHLRRLKFSSVLPRVFTEHGAIMAANILNSVKAVKTSVFVVRVFLKMRTTLNETRELAQKLAAVERELKGRLNEHEAAIVGVLERIMKIIDPPPAPPEEPKPQIGFHIKEDTVPYRVGKHPAPGKSASGIRRQGN